MGTKKVLDIMTQQVVTLNAKDDLVKAEALFKKYKIQHIPVVENKQIVGMLSWNDLLRVSFADAVNEDQMVIDNDMYGFFDVEKIMTSKVKTISADMYVPDAARLFVKEKFHALPVAEEQELVGILTTTDIIQYFLEN
ncbi:MAG: CBS domain-containing protein [Flavobacteriaceae bacterium]|nr:CBS domain-containing protein [Flavobacteriaceae bacterium]